MVMRVAAHPTVHLDPILLFASETALGRLRLFMEERKSAAAAGTLMPPDESGPLLTR